MADNSLDPAGGAIASAGDLSAMLGTLQSQSDGLVTSANSFAAAMSRAFTQAAASGKQLDTVLQSLALRMSALAVTQAFKPIASGITSTIGGGLSQLIGGTGGGFRLGAIKPFAAGGVIGAPTYFPMSSGGLGLAGEAGPEAIMPLVRGADGRLGVATSGQAPAANVTVQIATPDLGSFRRSEAYLTGQIARAVARGQRGF